MERKLGRQAPGNKRFALLAFWMAVAIAWLAVMPLALAVLDKAQIWWITTHNRYYLACHGKLDYRFPPSPPGLSSGPLKVKPIPVSWESTAPRPPTAPDWAVHRNAETPEEKRTRRMLFPSLSEEDRKWFAVGNGETILLFDAHGLRDAYCDEYTRHFIKHDNIGYLPVGLPLSEIEAKARQAAQDGRPSNTSLNLARDQRPFGDTDFFFLPVRDAGKVFVFVEFEYRTHQLKRMDFPEWSRWEVYGFSYKKNFQGTRPGETIRTNRYGYRAPDFAVPKPKGVFRILCLGGSTTYEGQDDESTYPALLQKELRALFPGRQIEVMNCGVEGMNSRSNFLHVPEYLELDPDLIISYLGVNDSQNDVQIICHATLSPWCDLLGRWTFLRHNFEWPFWPSNDLIRSRLQAVTITHLEGLRRIFARNGIRFALCSLAYVHYDDVSREKRDYVDTTCDFTGRLFAKLVSLLNPEIKKYCEQNGLLYIPVCENITDPDWLIDSCHLSQEGIALKAHIIAESIKGYIAPALEKSVSES